MDLKLFTLRQTRKYGPLLWGGALACAIAAVCLLDAAQADNKAQQAAQSVPAAVIVVQAKPERFSSTVHVTGYLVPSQEAIVTLDPEGYQITRIEAQEGDRVVAGQQLAKLERMGPALPGQQNMPVTIALNAPAGGRIEKSTAKLGGVAATKGDPLFRIATSDEIEMDAEVPGLYLGQIEPGRPVHVETPAGEVIGRVKRIGAEVDKTTQMGHVRVTLAPDRSLHVGAFVRATIDAGESSGIAVPRSAVAYGTDGTTVQVVRAQVVETRRVRIGLVSDHDAEIKEGVRNGELVVAHAGSSLRDGDHVTTSFAEESSQTGRH